MLLASITIPFYAHTCLKSNTTEISFSKSVGSCSMETTQVKCHTEKHASFTKKSKCCKSFNGTIDADTDLIISSVVDFQVDIAVLPLNPLFEKETLSNFSNHLNNNHHYIVVKEQVPLQIMQQSFLS